MKQKLVLLGLFALFIGYAQDLSTFTDYATINNELAVRDFAYIKALNVDDKLSAENISAEAIKTKKLKSTKVKTKQLKVTDDAEFKDDVLIEEDLTVEGTLNADTLGAICNLTVGCNILMNNSTSPLIGNILKNNIRFIHNFGTNNTFVGQGAGNFTLTGNNNSGYGANTLAGLTSGSGNIAVGSASGSAITSTSDNIDIGNAGVAGDIGTIRIGTVGTHTRAFLQGVYGVVLPGPGTQMVVMDPSGQLGTQAIGGGGNLFTSAVELQSPDANSICLILTDNAGVNERARLCSPGDGTNGLYMSANGGATQHLRLQADGDIALTNNLVFPASPSTLTTGNIFKGTELFMHNLGTDNTALGLRALDAVTTGFNNTAFGKDALTNLTTGLGNTAIGFETLADLTSTSGNVAVGFNALRHTIHDGNTAIGCGALEALTVGEHNIGIGFFAMLNNVSGNNNIAIGRIAGSNITNTNNNIDIGNEGVAGDAGVIRIGTIGMHSSTFLQGVHNVALSGPGTQMVVMDPSGQLGTQDMGTFTSSLNLNAPGSPDDICIIFNDNGGATERGRICSANDGTNGLYMSADGGTTQHLRLQADGDIALSNNLVFPASPSTLTTGNIFKGTELFMHNLGTSNTALGLRALDAVTTGFNNTAFGHDALTNLTTGLGNSAFGFETLMNLTTTSGNVAVGYHALNLATSGGNTAIGCGALEALTTGENNTALGLFAMSTNINGNDNIAIGAGAHIGMTSGNNNIAIGSSAGNAITTTSNNIHISNNGIIGDTGVIRIGSLGAHSSCFIAGIFDESVDIGTGLPTLIDSSGKLGTLLSSRRFKENINDIENVAELINKLRPVIFNYISDPSKTEQYGLIAEEVAEVCPGLVVFDKDGKPLTVKYHLLYALFIGLLKKHETTIKDLKTQDQQYNIRIADLESEVSNNHIEIDQLKKQLDMIQQSIKHLA